MSEIQRDAVLRRSYDLPDTILVSWISYRKRRTRDSSVAVLEHSAAGVCDKRRVNRQRYIEILIYRQ